MKKLFMLLGAFVISSTMAFAQFTFSGGAYTGVGVVAQDDNPSSATKDDAPYYVMSSQTHAPYRVFLNGDYTNADKTMGFSLAFQAAPPEGNPNYVTTPSPLMVPFSTASGWVKLFDNVVTLRAGYNVANPDFSFGRDSYMIARAGADADDLLLQSTAIDPGVVVMVSPFDGFAFGGRFEPESRSRDATYEGGVTYTIPRILALTAVFSRDTRDSSGTRGGSKDGKTSLTAGFRSVGIPDLNFSVAAKLDKLHDFNSTGTVLFVDYINYTMGNLRIGFDTNQQIALGSTVTTGAGTYDAEPLSFVLQPYVTYNLGKVSPRLDIAYIHNGIVYGPTLWTYDIATLTNIKGDYAFVVQPSVQWRAANGFTLNAGYKFSYGKSDQVAANERMLSMVYIDLVFRFVGAAGGASGGGNPNYPGGGGNPNFPGGGGNPNYR